MIVDLLMLFCDFFFIYVKRFLAFKYIEVSALKVYLLFNYNSKIVFWSVPGIQRFIMNCYQKIFWRGMYPVLDSCWKYLCNLLAPALLGIAQFDRRGMIFEQTTGPLYLDGLKWLPLVFLGRTVSPPVLFQRFPDKCDSIWDTGSFV